MSDQIKNRKNVSSIAIYIDEKLPRFGKYHKCTLKKITDTLFECKTKVLTQNSISYSNTHFFSFFSFSSLFSL